MAWVNFINAEFASKAICNLQNMLRLEMHEGLEVAPMLDIQFGQASDPGKVCTNNEDAMGYFIPVSSRQARTHGFLFAVADGVGGMDLGEVAAATAVSTLTDGFSKAQYGSMLISLMPQLFEQANAAVHDCTLQPQYRGKRMATTLVACALRHNQAIVSHVGDSRCYLVRNGMAKQVTQDHTWVNEQKKMGLISASEMAESDARHVILRALGTALFVTPDTTALTLWPGDVLVLCTDGLHDKMSASAIAAIVSKRGKIEEIASELVARAVENDGNDNTTAQVIRVRSVEQVGMYRGRPYSMSA